MCPSGAVTATLLDPAALGRVPGGEGGPAPRAVDEAGGALAANMDVCCAL